jgi:hypothetical protein
MKAYSRSKLCNILFMRELARRLHGTGVSEDQRESSRSDFQPDADLSGIVFREMNTGLLESFLYFEDG